MYLDCPTLPRCQSDLRNQVCQQWSAKCVFPPRPILTLAMQSAKCVLEAKPPTGFRTNGDRLDLNTLLDMRIGCIIRILCLEYLLSAESVHEGGSTCAVSQWGMADGAVCSFNIPVPEAPHTIKQNWIPFLTFFFLRILICLRLRSVAASACSVTRTKTNPSVVLLAQRCGQKIQ